MFQVSYQLSKEDADIIKDYYNCEAFPVKNNEYLYFQTRDNSVSISCYLNKKKLFKMLYSSSDEDKLLSVISQFKKDISVKDIVDSQNRFVLTTRQIGSDEVGKGDFFSGLFVVASYLEPKDLDILKELKITDSKNISDEHHLEIGEVLVKKIRYYSSYASPTKMSNAHQSGITTNKMLALLHNFTHKKLIEKYHLSNDIDIFVDQFESEKNYYSDVKSQIVKNKIFFHTQGELHYPSVATSSCIARYLFLKEWEKMEKDLGMKIPKGCGSDVVKTYNILKKRYPKEQLDKYVKTFFNTYQKNN